MDFGYFTLSDNHYANNPRQPNQFVSDILAEALYADQLGYHSAWIGEHHFSTLGVNSCPELLLSYLAARSKTIRLAPAVTVLPIHHPIRVAERAAVLDIISDGRLEFGTARSSTLGAAAPPPFFWPKAGEAAASGTASAAQARRRWRTWLIVEEIPTRS